MLGHGVVGVPGCVADGDPLLDGPIDVDEVASADADEGDELEIRRRRHDVHRQAPAEHQSPRLADALDVLPVVLRPADMGREGSRLLHPGEARAAHELADVPVGVRVDDVRVVHDPR